MALTTIKVKLPSGKIQSVKVPDDWDEKQITSSMREHFPDEYNVDQSKSMEMESTKSSEPKESTGLVGVAGDLAQGANNAFKFALDVPNKLEKSGKYIEEHPGKSILHNAGQLAAETADIGKGIINAPYNLNQYLARKHLLPQVLGKLGKLIPHLPEDMGVEKGLGLEADKEKGDELIRALPNALALGSGLKSIASQGRKAFKAPDLKQSIRETQKKVNNFDTKLGEAFDKVETEVSNRGIGSIPVSKNLISQAHKFLDKTPEAKDLINRAKKGEYKALRELQADLREIGETALSNKLTTERKVGKEALSVRKQINESIENHFDNTSHKDLANLLKETKKGYADLQKTYFSTPALAKVFGKSQKVPKNPKTLLTEESTEMKKFMSAHPEVELALVKALKHEGKMKTLKKAASILGIGTSAEVAREVLGGK